MQRNGAPGIVTGPFRLGAESIPSIQQFYANSVMEQISEGAAYPLCQPTQKNLPGCLCFVSKWQVRSVAGNYKSLTSHYICELFLTSILCNWSSLEIYFNVYPMQYLATKLFPILWGYSYDNEGTSVFNCQNESTRWWNWLKWTI